VVDALSAAALGQRVTQVVGIESRGFILAPPVALRLGAGFVPVRKPGKLPRAVQRQSYQLEYGTDAIEIHADALRPGDQVLVVDDVLATGGTAAAAWDLLEQTGAEVVAFECIVELAVLGGRARMGSRPVGALLVVP
jgi:adenine phosphoribosyltransferase